MTFAEVVAMLRRDGYMDAAILMEEQAMQILMMRQAMLENEALLKQLKVAMEDLAFYKEQASRAIELQAMLEEVTTERNQLLERMIV